MNSGFRGPDGGADESEAFEPTAIDGRRARRDRNRDTVVEALLDLYREGNLAPTVAEVAERSGVSHRSVFRYFEDLEELYRVGIEKNRATFAHLVPIHNFGRGPFDERVDHIVAQRMALFAEIDATAQVARMRAFSQPVLAEDLAQGRVFFRRQVVQQFEPELTALPHAESRRVLASVDVMLSYETFALLMRDHCLSEDLIAETIKTSLHRLFRPAE